MQYVLLLLALCQTAIAGPFPILADTMRRATAGKKASDADYFAVVTQEVAEAAGFFGVSQ